MSRKADRAAVVVHRGGKKAPRADGPQRRYLLHRLDAQHRKLEWDVGQAEKAAGRGWRRPDPPEIAAARALVEAYDEKIEAENKGITAALERLLRWLREQVMFRSADEALGLTKAYEQMTGEQALAAGRTMEDHNDVPLGLPGCRDVQM